MSEACGYLQSKKQVYFSKKGGIGEVDRKKCRGRRYSVGYWPSEPRLRETAALLSDPLR